MANIADEVAVLYAGTCMESGPAGSVLRDPQHPVACCHVHELTPPDFTTGVADRRT